MPNSAEYMKIYMRDRYQEKKEWAIAQLGGKCAQCGSADDLQFDHIDPKTKTATITYLLYKSKKRLEAELAKCQLLCFPCHKVKTQNDAGRVPARGTHGTLSAYRYCKCELCKAAMSEYNKHRKSRTRSSIG